MLNVADDGARRPNRSPDSHLRGIDPEVWRQRAKEARTFAELAMHVSTKNAFLEIAKCYDDLAASQKSSN